MRAQRAFSLLELLIVMAISVILIGLLFPAMRTMRQASLARSCASRIRQLELAHISYAMDHKGQFIDAGLPHGGSGDEDVAWINTLQPYFDITLAVRSPLDGSPHWPRDEGGQGVPVPRSTDRYRRTSYGINNALTRYASPFDEPFDRLTKVENHAATVHFLVIAFKGEYAGSDHTHFENWASPGDPNLPPQVAAEQVQTNAVRGPEAHWESISNYGFLDGHVETAPFSDVFYNFEVNRFDPNVSRLFATQRALGSAGD